VAGGLERGAWRGRRTKEAASGGQGRAGFLSQYLGARICGVEPFFSATYDATSEATLGSAREVDAVIHGVEPCNLDAMKHGVDPLGPIKFSRVQKRILFKKKLQIVKNWG